MDFNRGLETATNKQLLLNAVRASQRYPMHFSDVTQVISTPNVGGALGIGLPFGRNADDPFTASPSFTASQQDAITMVALNKENFYRGILKPIDFGTVGFYTGQGWPLEILIYSFIENIRLSETRYDFLLYSADVACKEDPGAPESQRQSQCDQLEENLEAIGNAGKLNPLSTVEERAISKLVDNDPEDLQRFLEFDAVALALQILNLEVTALGDNQFNTKSRQVTLKPAADSSAAATLGDLRIEQVVETHEAGSQDRLLLVIDVPKPTLGESKEAGATIDSVCETKSIGLSDVELPKPEDGKCGIVFRTAKSSLPKDKVGGTLRSPQGMLFYLGELIDAQTTGDPRAGALAANVFPIVVGDVEDAAVSVEYRGKTYSIPGGEKGRYAMQTLALINQIINLQKSNKELPTVPTVISVGG